MRLYSWSVAPNPRRVRMFLAEKGIDIEIVDVAHPDKWATVSDEYREKFPHRRVPLLELDDGDWIAETPAICRYLEALYPEPSLMGRTPREVAAVETWDRIAEWDGMMAAGEVYWNTSKAFAGRSLPGYREALPQIPALAERGELRLIAFYETLDERLSGFDYLAGDFFSLADITAFCAIGFAGLRKIGIPETCPNLLRWHAGMDARPSAQA